MGNSFSSTKLLIFILCNAPSLRINPSLSSSSELSESKSLGTFVMPLLKLKVCLSKFLSIIIQHLTFNIQHSPLNFRRRMNTIATTASSFRFLPARLLHVRKTHKETDAGTHYHIIMVSVTHDVTQAAIIV